MFSRACGYPVHIDLKLLNIKKNFTLFKLFESVVRDSPVAQLWQFFPDLIISEVHVVIQTHDSPVCLFCYHTATDFWKIYKYCKILVGWLVVLMINVHLAIFQPYLDLEADNQSLKIQVARAGIEPRSSCSASQELNHSATAAPHNARCIIPYAVYFREQLLWMALFSWVPIFVDLTKMTHSWGSNLWPYWKSLFRGYWNSWIGPSTKTTKMGTPRKLNHPQSTALGMDNNSLKYHLDSNFSNKRPKGPHIVMCNEFL